METKFLGTFKGEDMYGNEAVQAYFEYAEATIKRLSGQNLELELNALTTTI